jgi:hypothetical protein
VIPRCSCGAALIRTDIRGRFDCELREYCLCAVDCGSTTTILIEACPHANALIDDEGGHCECLDCGHEWYQDGDATPFEVQTRRGMVRL